MHQDPEKNECLIDFSEERLIEKRRAQFLIEKFGQDPKSKSSDQSEKKETTPDGKAEITLHKNSTATILQETRLNNKQSYVGILKEGLQISDKRKARSEKGAKRKKKKGNPPGAIIQLTLKEAFLTLSTRCAPYEKVHFYF